MVNTDSTSVSDWVGAITGLIAQVGESQQFQDGMTRAQEQVVMVTMLYLINLIIS